MGKDETKKESHDAVDSQPLQPNFLYCQKGPLGEGNYLLLCQHSYAQLYERLQVLAPINGANSFCCSQPDDDIAATERNEEQPSKKRSIVNEKVPKRSRFEWQKATQSIQNTATIRAVFRELNGQGIVDFKWISASMIECGHGRNAGVVVGEIKAKTCNL